MAPEEEPIDEPLWDVEALAQARIGILDVTRRAATMDGEGTVQAVLKAAGESVRHAAGVIGRAHLENEDEWLLLL